MSFIIITTTPSDCDIVTLYDTGPHTGSLVEGSHDTIALVVKHEVSLAVIEVIVDGGPVRNEYIYTYCNYIDKLHICICSRVGDIEIYSQLRLLQQQKYCDNK